MERPHARGVAATAAGGRRRGGLSGSHEVREPATLCPCCRRVRRTASGQKPWAATGASFPATCHWRPLCGTFAPVGVLPLVLPTASPLLHRASQIDRCSVAHSVKDRAADGGPGPGRCRSEPDDAAVAQRGTPLALPGPAAALAGGLCEEPAHSVALPVVEAAGDEFQVLARSDVRLPGDVAPLPFSRVRPGGRDEQDRICAGDGGETVGEASATGVVDGASKCGLTEGPCAVRRTEQSPRRYGHAL